MNSELRRVHCLICNMLTILKPTKTKHIMLRCNNCNVLIYANGGLSQQRLISLNDYVPLIWVSATMQASSKSLVDNLEEYHDIYKIT